MCCTNWVRNEGIRSEESGICDGIFEGSAILRLVSENIVVESVIRDGFLNLRDFVFFLLDLGFVDARTFGR